MKVRWGVLSTARIGVKNVIPGMLQGEHCEMVGIASRDLGKARVVAAELGLPRAYGSTRRPSTSYLLSSP